jgi:hypothetical protein
MILLIVCLHVNELIDYYKGYVSFDDEIEGDDFLRFKINFIS